MENNSLHVQTLQDLAEENENLYVWVIGFGITHEVMRLGIHKGTFPKRIEVTCSGVSYFSGKLKGGPYAIKVFEQEMDDGKVVVLTGNNSELVIKCEGLGELIQVHGGIAQENEVVG